MRILLYFCLGASIGSFLGVVIDRFPHQSIISPPSHCSSCGTRLKLTDLCPILSQICSGFRCRYCHVRLPYWYAGLELICGLSFIFWDLGWLSIWQGYFCLFSLTLAGFDLKEKAYPLVIWLIGSVPLFWAFGLSPSPLIFLLIAILAELRNLRIGSGDFLYLASMSLLSDTQTVFWTMQISCLLAICYLLLTDRRRSLAFVPFLLLGYVLTLILVK